MCGIVGITGAQEPGKQVIRALERLEYRGYDSAGVALFYEDEIRLLKIAEQGNSINRLKDWLLEIKTNPISAIGHTRWATHGKPTQLNAHPHTDCNNSLAIVHNGILENYLELKNFLIERGHSFVTETDSEVIAHLYEEQISHETDYVKAFVETIKQLKGTYAVVAVNLGNPSVLLAAKYVSPLIVAKSARGCYVVSDPSAIVGIATTAWDLQDGQIAVVNPADVEFLDYELKTTYPPTIQLNWSLSSVDKKSHDTYMHKEIYEQTQAVASSLIGRYKKDDLFDEIRCDLSNVKKVIFIGAGSSYHACMIGKYAFEELTELDVQTDISSEFRYRKLKVQDNNLVIAISQSGETIDTLRAIDKAKSLGAKAIGVVNVIGSSIARESDGVIYTRAGPEIGVAATKTYITQIACVNLLARYFSDTTELLFEQDDVEMLVNAIDCVLKKEQEIKDIAAQFANIDDFLFIGRHVGYPTASEGALKLKEISYMHAEAYPAGELKHGPIAMIEEKTGVVAIGTTEFLKEKISANLQEVSARGAQTLVLVNENTKSLENDATYSIEVPAVPVLYSPMVDVVVLQLLAYHLAKLRGLNVDKPRNLAKTVTVE